MVLMAMVRESHPPFRKAVAADARVTASYRGDRSEFQSKPDTFVQVLRLALVHDSFFAQCCYRAKARAQSRGVPVVPHLLHRLAIMTGQVCIGDPVVVEPGLYLPHGQVVIDGITRIEPQVVIRPFVTIGLRDGYIGGPTIERGASIGTGAKIFGPVRIGERARIGANAVVMIDVPAGATAVGAPARVVASSTGPGPDGPGGDDT
jgi:serine O-acetyltransferase